MFSRLFLNDEVDVIASLISFHVFDFVFLILCFWLLRQVMGRRVEAFWSS